MNSHIQIDFNLLDLEIIPGAHEVRILMSLFFILVFFSVQCAAYLHLLAIIPVP